MEGSTFSESTSSKFGDSKRRLRFAAGVVEMASSRVNMWEQQSKHHSSVNRDLEGSHTILGVFDI